MSEPILPSPAASVASAIAAELRTDGGTAADLVETIQAAAVIPPKNDQNTTAKVDPPKPSEPPTLATASDDVEPVVAKPAALSDEPHEGEKPAVFIKRLKQEKADALNQLKTALESKSKTADPDEIAALRKELTERDSIIERDHYANSKVFRDGFIAPIEKASAAAKELIGKFTDTKGVFERALALDSKERADYLVETVGETAASTIFDRISRVDELSKDRDAALGNAQERAKVVAAERDGKETTLALKAFDSERDYIAKRLSIYRGEHGDALTQQARSLISGEAAPKDIIQAAYLAVAAPHYIGMVKELQAKVALYEARDAEREAGQAGIHGRGTDKTAGSDNPVHVNGAFPDIATTLKRQLASVSRG